MHCVVCGTHLQGTNQEGLVCVSCKQGQRGLGNKQLVRVQHCFRCGQPYAPQDSSIQHLFCSQGETHRSIASTPTDTEEIIQLARRRVHVPVLVLPTQENAGL